jgi:hypothetical protein
LEKDRQILLLNNVLRPLVFAALKAAGKSNDPMFFYAAQAQDTLSHVYSLLKEQYPSKNALRAYLMDVKNKTYVSGTAVEIYNQLYQTIIHHRIQNVAPLWRGFPEDNVMIRDEGTVPTGFPPGSNIFSNQETK